MFVPFFSAGRGEREGERGKRKEGEKIKDRTPLC